MADSRYESKIGQIVSNATAVYAVLSNLENINHFRDVIPQDKIQDLEISSDRIRFKVEGLGQKIAIAILEKEECKTIKFGAEKAVVNKEKACIIFNGISIFKNEKLMGLVENSNGEVIINVSNKVSLEFNSQRKSNTEKLYLMRSFLEKLMES